jgi:hypothetical protein
MLFCTAATLQLISVQSFAPVTLTPVFGLLLMADNEADWK